MLEHQHLVGGGDGDRAARAAFADDHGDVGDAEREAGVGRAGDRLGLAALLGVDAGKGAGGVDEGDDRKLEAVGKLHEAGRLAIALGPGHAEIVLEAALRVVALLLADDDDGCAAEPAETADDRLVLAEIAVAGERGEVGDQTFQIVGAARPPLDARDLGFLPGGEGGVEVGERLLRLRLELGDLLGERGQVALLGDGAQFVDAGVDIGDGLFETQIGAHEPFGRPAGLGLENGAGNWPLLKGEVKAASCGPPGGARPAPLAPTGAMRHERRGLGV